jgi:hypothetical protein
MEPWVMGVECSTKACIQPLLKEVEVVDIRGVVAEMEMEMAVSPIRPHMKVEMGRFLYMLLVQEVNSESTKVVLQHIPRTDF